MSQDFRLYRNTAIWDQPLQRGQSNLLQAIRDFWPQRIASILDVGCGDGKLTAHLTANDETLLIGLDSSDEALSRLSFAGVKGDAAALPFADAAFDLVISTDTLEHMPEATEGSAWSELFRVAADTVMVAVPFREELLDATTRCAQCGHRYHVNWHQRSYDIADLHRHTPAGWHIRSTVLTGEAWSPMLPPETRLRREAMDEWSGWHAAICPICGSGGHAAAPIRPLPALLARALGEQLYPALRDSRFCRSHSEILVVFQRRAAASTPPQSAVQHCQQATCIDFDRQPMAPALNPFCQVAQYAAGTDGTLRLQFPLYEPNPILEIRRRPGRHGALRLSLEDADGLLLDGCVLAEGQDCATLTLPRPPVAGYYGILASCPEWESLASIRLGEGPAILWLQPPHPETTAYWHCEHANSPLFVQISEPAWFDPRTLTDAPNAATPTPANVINGLQACFEAALNTARKTSIDPEHENALLVQIQNLSAERDALLDRVRHADALAVRLQNLTAERDALFARVQEADRFAVRYQNLSAEREALLARAQEADRLAVQCQNLLAECDALRAQVLQREPDARGGAG